MAGCHGDKSGNWGGELRRNRPASRLGHRMLPYKALSCWGEIGFPLLQPGTISRGWCSGSVCVRVENDKQPRAHVDTINTATASLWWIQISNEKVSWGQMACTHKSAHVHITSLDRKTRGGFLRASTSCSVQCTVILRLPAPSHIKESMFLNRHKATLWILWSKNSWYSWQPEWQYPPQNHLINTQFFSCDCTLR